MLLSVSSAFLSGPFACEVVTFFNIDEARGARPLEVLSLLQEWAEDREDALLLVRGAVRGECEAWGVPAEVAATTGAGRAHVHATPQFAANCVYTITRCQ